MLTSAEQNPDRWQRALVWALLAACATPTLLNLLGIRFQSASGPDVSGSYSIGALLPVGALCACTLIGVLAWVRHCDQRSESVTLILAIALLLAGWAQALTLIVACGYMDNSAQGIGSAAYLDGASRAAYAATLLAGVLAIRWLKRRSVARATVAVVVCATCAVAITGLGGAIAAAPGAWRWVDPARMISRPLDLLALVLLVPVGLLLFRIVRRTGSLFASGLLLGLVPDALAQLHLAIGSTALFDNHYQIAQTLRVLAVLPPLAALCLEGQRLSEDAVPAGAILPEGQTSTRTLLESGANAIITIDTKGVVLSCNATTEQMFGYAVSELIDQSVSLIIPETHRDRHDQYIADYLRTGITPILGRSRELQAQRKDGSHFAIELMVTENGRGRARTFTGNIRDITSQTQKRQERIAYAATLEEGNIVLEGANSALAEANHQLAQRNRELDEFTYMASHDLVEPLRKLTAFSELLATDIGGDLPKQAADDLKHITNATSRMNALVQDLLVLSRTGRSALAIERVALDDCVDSALDNLSVAIEETGARITRPERLPTVDGDATVLTQLWQNLLSNALKFHRPGIEPRVEITLHERNGETIIGVRDEGIGLKPEFAEQIFTPFKRLHGRNDYEGTGIGLAICRKAIERHGGRIWLEAAPGEGAHFQFTIGRPLEPQPCKGAQNVQASYS